MKYEEFEKLTTTQKGTYGENLVKKYLLNKGIICYKPEGGAHDFDFLLSNRDKMVIAEVKTKPRMFKKHPELNNWYGTGVENKSIDLYKKKSKELGIPVYLYFVDEIERRIYGNDLSILEKDMMDSKPSWNLPPSKIFSLKNVETVAHIGKEDVEKIKKLSTGKYKDKYNNVQPTLF